MSDTEEIAEWKDFSSSSTFEKEIEEAEKIFESFQIGMKPKIPSDSNNLQFAKDDIRVESYTFTLYYYYGNYIPKWDEKNCYYPASLIEMMDSSKDLEKIKHYIHRWFGISEFVYASIDKIHINSLDLSISNHLLSVLSVAMSHRPIQVPLFVKCFDKDKEVIGVLPAAEGMISPTIHFSLSNYKNTNQSQSIQDIALWIQNRLNVVKGVQNNDTIQLPMSITPKYSWSWPTTVMKKWRKSTVTKDASLYALQNYTNHFLWGTVENEIDTYRLKILWDAKNDYHLHAPEPLQGTKYQLYVLFNHKKIEDIDMRLSPLCANIFDALTTVLNKNYGHNSMYAYGATNKQLEIEKLEKNKHITEKTSLLIGNAINRIAGSQTLPSLQELQDMFTSIFSENQREEKKQEEYRPSSSAYYPRAQSETPYQDILGSSPVASLFNLLIFRSSSFLSLSPDYVLSIIWHDFIEILKSSLSDLSYIPNLETALIKDQLAKERPPLPNLRDSYIYQKLQMLNLCIDELKQREEEKAAPCSQKEEVQDGWEDEWDENWEDNEESYITIQKPGDSFDTCSDEENEKSTPELTEEEKYYTTTGIKPNLPLYQQNKEAPQGHRGVYMQSDLYLLHTHIPLFVPLTADPQIVTEDMLRRQQEELEQMGDDALGVDMRRQQQSPSLISDMSAFKAANPRCTIEDFIRWHSPNDWIVPEGKSDFEGHLSLRMSDTTNDFYKYWNQAEPLTIFEQKPLYDFEKEAMNIVKDLEALSPVSFLLMSSLTFLTSVLYILDTIPHFHSFSLLNTMFDELVKKIHKYSTVVSNDLNSLLYTSETTLNEKQKSSILTKFNGILSLIQDIEYKSSLMTSYMTMFNNIDVCKKLLEDYSTFESAVPYVSFTETKEKECILDVLNHYHLYDNPESQCYLIHTAYPQSTSVTTLIDQLLPVGHRFRFKRTHSKTEVSECITYSDILI